MNEYVVATLGLSGAAVLTAAAMVLLAIAWDTFKDTFRK